MLMQSFTRSRPPQNRSQAYSGVQPLSPFTHRTQRFEPLPPPLGEPPYHYDLETVVPGVGQLAAQNGRLVFQTVGDTGGIKHAERQMYVADAMKEDATGFDPQALAGYQGPVFFYHLGDVVYYNGEFSQYYDQFYEPYDHYGPPIFAIPGNHDGSVPDASQTSLAGWVAYFMTGTPHIDPASQDAPRLTLSQPNVYFTLLCPFVTIVGLYTNVPDHGSVDSVQQQWLAHELATAPQDKALLVCLHHPVYSFDAFHSGSPNMADLLQHAINDSRRVPNMVLAGHVHNYQRIERGIAGDAVTPFLVAGNGGYFNLHHMNAGVGTTDPNTNAQLMFSEDRSYGYVTLTVDAKSISGSFTAVGKSGAVTRKADSFSYSAAPLFLPAGATINL